MGDLALAWAGELETGRVGHTASTRDKAPPGFTDEVVVERAMTAAQKAAESSGNQPKGPRRAARTAASRPNSVSWCEISVRSRHAEEDCTEMQPSDQDK